MSIPPHSSRKAKPALTGLFGQLFTPTLALKPIPNPFVATEKALKTRRAQRAAPPALQQAYLKIRARAVALAGKPEDIPQRVVFLNQIFRDSHGNNCFPQVALHGALWADDYFKNTAPPLMKLASEEFFFDPSARAAHYKMLADFGQRLRQANRSVFIDTYTNYYFTKEFGHAPGADRVVTSSGAPLNPQLLSALNTMNDATRQGRQLTASQKRDLFQTALKWEQESTVAPQVQQAAQNLRWPIVKQLALKPVVHFAYFPCDTYFAFDDFSNERERIQYATRSYDLAVKAGWPAVESSMADYGVLPPAFFRNPDAYAATLQKQLL